MPPPFRNTPTQWGWSTILLHWLTAITALTLFGVGLWMTELEYDNPWYHEAPFLHKSVGMCLLAVLLLRLGLRLISPVPQPVASLTPRQAQLAHWMHITLYLLLFSIIATGYLISTAKGHPVSVFGLVDIPALPWTLGELGEDVGDIHLFLASVMIGCAALHAAAAVAHHVVYKDATLKRMLGKS